MFDFISMGFAELRRGENKRNFHNAYYSMGFEPATFQFARYGAVDLIEIKTYGLIIVLKLCVESHCKIEGIWLAVSVLGRLR